MKDILIITNYFPPEIGAASNRIFHLAEGLQKRDFKVSVITPLPNYPRGKIFEGYKGKFKHTSTENNITVHRLWIFASKSKNKILRLIAMMSYSFSLLLFFVWNKAPKTIIAVIVNRNISKECHKAQFSIYRNKFRLIFDSCQKEVV